MLTMHIISGTFTGQVVCVKDHSEVPHNHQQRSLKALSARSHQFLFESCSGVEQIKFFSLFFSLRRR